MRLCLLLAAAAGARARLAPRDREIARLTGGRRLSDSNPGVSFEQLVKMTASDAAMSDYFGRSVAVDGDTIVIGAYNKDDETGAVYVLRASDGEELAKLTASDGAAGDKFGWSVAIDGDTIVIGAYLDDDGGGSSGSVYVFRTSDGGATYGQVAKLTAADASVANFFGVSVAIDGNTVVVGANAAGTGGAVYVFRTTDGGATYDQVAKLTASDAASNDRFGNRVAIDGDTIVVGAYNDGNTGVNLSDGSGSVYVFRTTDGGATYGQVAKLTAADAAAGDYFGNSVAIDGDTIVVGAPGCTYSWCPAVSGSVYVFRTTDDGATYDQVAKLTADDAAASDQFGISVAIDGDTIVIGANWDDDGGSRSGSAYVFRTTDDGATYGQVAKLTASDAATQDFFGSSVAIDGATVVVGARGDSHDGGAWAGSAYVFSSDSNYFSSQTSKDDVVDDDKMMALVVLAGLLGLSLAAGLLLFALRQQQLAAKKSRAPRTSTVTAVEPRAPRKFTVTAVEPRAPRKFTVTAVQPRAPRKFTVTAVQSV